MRGDEEIVVNEIEEEENIDLNLSLSSNGRFGVDPQQKKTVTKSASHSNVTFDKRSSTISDEYGTELKMWPSIPTVKEEKETEMGRKESQSLGLLDANRKRSLGLQGTNKCSTGQGFPADIGCSTDKNEGKRVETVAENNISSKAILADEDKERVFYNADMPYVFTTIYDRKTEGFLYKYNHEQEINIICACHGCSMTPAEFIKHAGGGDVANPLRHIIINYALGGDNVGNPLN